VFLSNKKIISLYSLNTLLSATTRSSAQLPISMAYPRDQMSSLQWWWVAGNVWEIWSAQDLNPIPPTPEADRHLTSATPIYELFANENNDW